MTKWFLSILSIYFLIQFNHPTLATITTAFLVTDLILKIVSTAIKTVNSSEKKR